MRKYEIISYYEGEGYSHFNDVLSWRGPEGVICKVYCLDEYNMIVSMDFPVWYK